MHTTPIAEFGGDKFVSAFFAVFMAGPRKESVDGSRAAGTGYIHAWYDSRQFLCSFLSLRL